MNKLRTTVGIIEETFPTAQGKVAEILEVAIFAETPHALMMTAETGAVVEKMKTKAREVHAKNSNREAKIQLPDNAMRVMKKDVQIVETFQTDQGKVAAILAPIGPEKTEDLEKIEDLGMTEDLEKTADLGMIVVTCVVMPLAMMMMATGVVVVTMIAKLQL